MFDPETILCRVWQRDIPAGWHVYPRLGWRAWMFGAILSMVLIVAALVPFLFGPGFWLQNTAVFAGIIMVAIVMGSLFLVFGARQGLNFPLSGNPDGVLVVMPEGMVEYVSTHVPIYTLPFAEVRELSRHQTNGRAWLKVTTHDENLAEWTPRTPFGEREKGYLYEEIFKRVIEAFEMYRVKGVGEEMTEEGGGKAVL